MAVVLALPRLFDAVVDRFADEGTAVTNAFGWREPARRTGEMRIVWVPGDDQSGALGDVLSARNPGRNPRPLATLGELFTVFVEAVDATAPEDERKQYEAARVLFDAWFRAVYLAARGTVAIRSAAWVTSKKERRYGATLRVVCSVEAMVPDAPAEIAPADARAVIDVEELDVTEQMESAPAP